MKPSRAIYAIRERMHSEDPTATMEVVLAAALMEFLDSKACQLGLHEWKRVGVLAGACTYEEVVCDVCEHRIQRRMEP